MNIFTKKLGCSVIALGMMCLTSCASYYKPINAPAAPYTYSEQADGLAYSYQYDMLQLNGNKKYAKRELKNNIKVVAVKVTNTTDSTLHIGNDFKVMLGNLETTPVPPTVVAQKLKQGVPIYLLYLLLNLNFTTTVDGQVSESKFIPTGPPIAAYNLIVAANANSRFKQELITQNLLDKTVAPGETVFGLVSLNTLNAAPVRLMRRKPILSATTQQ